jgi:hypothetical protein
MHPGSYKSVDELRCHADRRPNTQKTLLARQQAPVPGVRCLADAKCTHGEEDLLLERPTGWKDPRSHRSISR